MKKCFIPILVVSLIAGCKSPVKVDPLPVVSSGTIERIENLESKFVIPRNIDIWLPEGYNPGEKYPVLYMHDGLMLFDSAITWNHQEWGIDELFTRLIEEGTVNRTIVVGIFNSGETRYAEYFPQGALEMLPQSYLDSLITEVKKNDKTATIDNFIKSDNYLRFLTEELKPLIDKKYSTKADRENTFICGSSMGGLISMYAICEYPEIFGGAACLSTHWSGTVPGNYDPIPGAIIKYLDKNLPSPADHRIYFDYGTETLDALYEPYQQRADEVMRRHGYDETNWKTIRFDGDDHSENSWRKRLHIPVTFLMGNG